LEIDSVEKLMDALPIVSNKDECTIAICNFPISWKLGKSLTLNDIYMATRYEEFCLRITQDEILNIVKNNPELIDKWHLYSQDKRCSPAWYMENRAGNFWEVGFEMPKGKRGYRLSFIDPSLACSLMIRMEMETFRLIDDIYEL